MTERVLFVGGPVHGEVRVLRGEPWHYVVLASAETGRMWPEDLLYEQVRYSRVRLALEVDGEPRVRSVFTQGGRNPSQSQVQDAVTQAWFAGRLW